MCSTVSHTLYCQTHKRRPGWLVSLSPRIGRTTILGRKGRRDSRALDPKQARLTAIVEGARPFLKERAGSGCRAFAGRNSSGQVPSPYLVHHRLKKKTLPIIFSLSPTPNITKLLQSPSRLIDSSLFLFSSLPVFSTALSRS
jgi:hypothetical protein